MALSYEHHPHRPNDPRSYSRFDYTRNQSPGFSSLGCFRISYVWLIALRRDDLPKWLPMTFDARVRGSVISREESLNNFSSYSGMSVFKRQNATLAANNDFERQ